MAIKCFWIENKTIKKIWKQVLKEIKNKQKKQAETYFLNLNQKSTNQDEYTYSLWQKLLNRVTQCVYTFRLLFGHFHSKLLKQSIGFL